MSVGRRIASKTESDFGAEVHVNRCILTYGLCITSAIFSIGCKTAPEFTGRVTVLTYDADDASTLTPEIERAIADANADVVCVQEARPDWCRTFKRQFRHRYRESLYIDQGFLDFGRRPAIFSKYEIREVQYVPPTHNGWSHVWIVEAQTPAGPVQIANICLSQLVTGFTGRGAGVHAIATGHESEMHAILSAMTPKVPSLIVGNFNGDPTDPGVQRARRSGFIDALARFDERTPTWRSRRMFVPVSGQRDHILCSSHFQADMARVLPSRESDHCPVVAELSLVKTPTSVPVAARE